MKFFVFVVALLFLSSCAEPEVSKSVLPNGFTTIVKENPDTGMVALNLFVKRSIAADGSLFGLSNLVNRALLGGTDSRSHADIIDSIEGVGGSIEAKTYVEWSEILIEVPAAEFDLALDILHDVVVHPTFPQLELERERDLIISEVRAKVDQPQLLAEEEFMRGLYRGHPYANPVDGSVESLQAISRDDVVAHHRNWYAPNHLILVVAGNVDSGKVLRDSFDYFDHLSANDVVENIPVVGSQLGGSISRDEISESFVVHSGFLTTPASHSDFVSLRVASAILGMGSGSRLFYEVREKRGLVYGIYSLLPSVRETGFLKVVMTVNPDALNESIDVVNSQIARIRSEPVSVDELNLVKRKLKGFFFLDHQKSRDQANYLGLYEVQNLGYEFDVTYPLLIDNVSVADVQYVSSKYLLNPFTAIVGPFSGPEIK